MKIISVFLIQLFWDMRKNENSHNFRSYFISFLIHPSIN